jgi:hypothetical protein
VVHHMTSVTHPMRVSILLLTVCSLSVSCNILKQGEHHVPDRNEQLHPFQSAISEQQLKDHLYLLASDSLLGRGTGEPGIDMAADYLSDHHAAFGMLPIGDDSTYFQNFYLNARVNESISLDRYIISGSDTQHVGSSRLERGKISDFYPVLGGELPVEGKVVYAGTGIKDEERGVNHIDGDITGKWVLIFNEIPYISDGDTLISPELSNRDRFNQLLFREGVAGVLIIRHTDRKSYEHDAGIVSNIFGNPSGFQLEYMQTGRGGPFGAAIYNISPDMAANLLGIETEGLESTYTELIRDIQGFKPVETGQYIRSAGNSEERTIPAKNVLSMLEGCDPDLKHEVVVISAHYDHMGLDTPDVTGDYIYNGADDNGSGTVATLAIAEALAEARDNGACPARSVMFLHVTAEERGLLGSRYYSDHPVLSIENTVANINIDMIGRIDANYSEEENGDYLYIIGAEIISSGLDSLLQEANSKSENLYLDMRYNDLDDPNQFYRRSDHWNFGRFGVPFAFFFTGVHADYHRPSDTPDKIEYEHFLKRVRVAYATVVEIANAPERPVVDSQEFIRRTELGR